MLQVYFGMLLLAAMIRNNSRTSSAVGVSKPSQAGSASGGLARVILKNCSRNGVLQKPSFEKHRS